MRVPGSLLVDEERQLLEVQEAAATPDGAVVSNFRDATPPSYPDSALRKAHAWSISGRIVRLLSP